MDAPSKILLGLEAIRGLYEYGLGCILSTPLKYISPKGDGHPVMVIPGLGTSDGSTQYVRHFLNELGYTSYTWGLGRNLGPRNGIENLLEEVVSKLREISEMSGGQQVSVIGWSLGGIYGREIAKLAPDLVRQVITLGTPFKNENGGTNAGKLYEILSKDASHKDPEVLKRISTPPPVPFTSIYSKTDGVVHWQCSVEELDEYTENIEIPAASHLGLGHNPISMYVIADRLTQSKKNWTPYKAR
jgi:esterase/lipase